MRKHGIALAAAATLAGAAACVPAAAQDKITTIGVSVPAADHGWTGGIDYFAQTTIDRLGKAYPNLKFVLATAPDAGSRRPTSRTCWPRATSTRW